MDRLTQANTVNALRNAISACRAAVNSIEGGSMTIQEAARKKFERDWLDKNLAGLGVSKDKAWLLYAMGACAGSELSAATMLGEIIYGREQN